MTAWDKIKYWLMMALGAFVVLSFVAQKWNAPHYGDECGPGHHWVLVGPPGDPDLSCEADP